MAEEFVDIEQNGDPLGILSKKTVSPNIQETAPIDSDPLGILKKKSTPVVSSGTPSQLPSQPDFLQQGASLADNSFLKKISKSAAQSVAQPSSKSKLPLEGFSQKQIDLLKKGVEKPAQKTSGGLMIPTNLPKEDGEDKDEWKLKNLVQNVFANFELAGTDLLANALTVGKDMYQTANPFAPNIPSTETKTREATPTPWELDPYGNVIRGLHGNQERMKGVIANNPLPNTFWGKAVSSVASFAPDIAAAGLFPGAPLFKGASFLAKTGNLLLNDFTRYSIVKGGLSGYGEARKEGKDIGEASLEGGKGAGKGLATGAELAVLGAGSNLATKSIMNKLENYGLGNMTTRQLVGLGNDVLAYGIVSPFSHAALEGRLATADEIANGTGVAALFRLKGALKDIKSNADLNKAIKETLEVKQGVAVSNFVDATPESIVEVYNSKGSADEFQLRALAAAKKARETTDLEKKAKYVAEASTLVRAANVKQVAEMVINNNDGFAEFKASDLPDSAKKEFLQKAEEINKLLNPFEKAKTDLDNKIKESEDLFSQLSQQAEQSQDPNERAQLEAQAREAKDNAEKFRNELSEVKFNQNKPDVNAGKAPVMEGEVAPAEVKIGDSVQWTSQGTDQFAEPRKIKSISEDGKYAFVEGSDTGIPVAELSVTEVKPTEVNNVEQLRAEEQAELDSKIPNAEQYRVDGKVDRTKLTNEEDIKAFDEVYNKYDKLISPLLEKPLEKSKPQEDEISVYHGGSVKDLSTTEGGLFVSADKNQAESYAKGNKGQVQEFKLNKKDISNEDNVREVINELGLKSKEEGWDLNDLMLHEIIDPRFETSLSDGDLNKLFKELDKRGYKAIEMLATDVSGKQRNVKDILVLNPKETLIEAKPIEEKLKKGEKYVYHHTSENISNITEGSAWFTSNKFGTPTRARGINKIVKIINPSDFNLAPNKEFMSLFDMSLNEKKKVLQERGYEGVKRTIDGDSHYWIFDVSKLKDVNIAEKAKEVKQTEAKPKEEKTFAQKDLDRAEAKKIHSRVAEMEPPSDAEQVALRYLAEGGKVSQDAINEVSGTTKRASLNTGRRELKTAEAKARDYAGGNESLDDLAHRLWESSGQEISERDIKDALMSEIGNNNTRLDASKAYLERYNPEYKEEQYYNRLAEERKDEFLKEQDELEKQLRKPLDEQIEGEASEEHINNLIKQYEAEFERENKQLESEGKGKADKEISGRDGGKEGLKEEYQKIKSNKKKKDFVRNNLPEEFKPLADELTEAQMSEIVDSNFDSKTIKNIQDAIQKQGAAEVLQPKQEEDGGAGGGRKRVEQGKQGDEPAGTSEAKTAEKAQPKSTEEGEIIGITHEQLNEVARELDFPEYEASPETIEQWDARAKEELAKGPEAVNNLIAKYEKNILPEPWEQRMMLMIISSAKAKINANPSPENLAQFKRIMELSNNVGGRVVAQSLRARQGVKQVADTLPDFLLMRENDRGYPFTESEIKEQAKVFEELKKEKDALKEALQKSEEANAKLIAEMGVNKAKAAAKKAAKKTREEYVIERKQSVADAREALKKLRTGEKGITAVVVPYFRELKAVSPHVKKYIKSLVEEGVNKLDDIVNDTYAEFKDIVDGMTKKDILDIFNGEYDESKPRTRNEKTEELRLLQREAALVKELENVRKGIEKEKNPAQKVKKNDRITELEDKIKEVKRLNKERDRVPQEFTEPEFALKTEGELLASKRKMLTKRIEKLQDDIKNKRYLEEKKAPPKLELDRKTQLLKDRVIKMEREIEAERQKDAYKKMSKTEKYFNHFNQITGIRRVMQTAFDLSVSLRQGVLVAFNPRKWDVFSKAFGNQMKSVFSDKKYNSLMYDIHNSSEYNKMLEDGIKFNELDALKNEERNEDFQKSFLYGIKIPIVRQLITEPLLASQRAADGFLNTARYELYLKYEKQLLKQGITRQSDPEAYKKMADLVMNMTGRGKLISHLESGKWNKVVSNTFYGARLMAANINSLNPVKYYKLPPGVRKEVMKDMLSYVTTTAGIMLAASAAGATVELDPDKPDFLQIRKDDKVYDITGGKAAYLRTFFRMVSGLYSRVTDNKYTYGKKLERAGTSITNFFRNKLAPNVGYGVNMLYGENTLNQDFDPYEALEAYPMYADDFAEALKDEGITSLATVLAPNILGIGYGSYANQANKESLESSLERMLNSDEMNPELIKNHKDGGRVINEKEFDELAKLRDANIEKEIRRLYDGKSKFNLTLDKGNVVTKKVKDMTEEEVKKAKKSIASEATRLSKEQLFGKEKKTREEKMEDKRLSRARKRFD
jgi:hypothetical protein